jgi:hypothetical protein
MPSAFAVLRLMVFKRLQEGIWVRIPEHEDADMPTRACLAALR